MEKRRDHWLTAICALAMIAEALWRGQVLSVAVAVAISVALGFRRSRPLAATASVFAFLTALTLYQIARSLPEAGPYSSLCVLLLPYSLGRFGGSRDVAVGGVFMLAAYTASMFHGEGKDVGEMTGGALFLFFPLAVGVAMRFRAAARAHDIANAKLREREKLARELHDSVAHHMTAITIQAQAARAVISMKPDAAARALDAIEAESRRTLSELRDIVGALRDDAALAPQGRIADIASFARDGVPMVTVELAGDLGGLSAAVERAVYRLAQESVTNAIKHAKDATRIEIRVAAEGAHIHVTARDDGAPVAAKHAGFGLVGMAERAALLGGTFSAGPAERGWQVEALLPRTAGEQ